MSVSFAHVCAHLWSMYCVQCLGRPEEGKGSPADGSEPWVLETELGSLTRAVSAFVLLTLEPSLRLLGSSISDSSRCPLIHYVAQASLYLSNAWEARELGEEDLIALAGLPICRALDTWDTQ